jgi:predicted amidohydrolase YtcJ
VDPEKEAPDPGTPSDDPSPGGREISRKQFLAGGAAIGALGLGAGALGLTRSAQAAPAVPRVAVGAKAKQPEGVDLALINGKIHTMDPANPVVSEVLISEGRFVQVGNPKDRPGKDKKDKVKGDRDTTVIDLRGKTVIPGLIDAHTHIVLVGNRPGHHVLQEDVFTIPEAVARYQARAASVPEGEFVTTVGPISAMQFNEQRLPNLTELDAVNRPVYIQAAQGGTRTNTLGKAWLNARGVTNIAADGTVGGGATGSTLALQLLRQQQLNDDLRRQNSLEALAYYTRLGITTHLDQGAFQSDTPSGGIANENNYTMYNSFLALNRDGLLPARLRINFLHQDSATPPVTLPTLSQRLKNSFPFFGDDMLRTGGIGEFTGGGVDGLVAIASAGWRAEDHSLNLASFQTLVQQREACNAQVPISGLRWVIAHVPQTNTEYVNRWKALGGGLVVGWGPTRTGTNVGPVYRTLFDNGINLGYHADGGDITVINPWLNFYTINTGRNLQIVAGQSARGALINEGQTLTRQEILQLATRNNKWFIHEDDLGSIEVGNHADLVVLNQDFMTVPDADILKTRSLLTVVGGNVVHDAGAL